MAYGVDDSGFILKRLENILDDAKAKIRAKYPEALLTDETIEGQFINIASDVWSIIWEGLQDVYHASHIQFAENASLDFLIALNNMQRRAATKSKLPNVVITGVPATSIPAGFRAYASTSANLIWETVASAVVGPGGTVTTDFYCTVTGPNDISTSTLDTILTPITGITAVDNPDTTLTGSDIETDAELLARRNNEIANSQGGSHYGLYNAINNLNVDETLRIIEFIRIISNRTDSVDAGNRPAHSFEAILTDAATYTSVSVANGTINNSTNTLTVVGQDVSGIYSVDDIIAISSDYNTFAKEKFTITGVSFAAGNTTITLNANYKGSSTAVANTWTVTGKDDDIALAIWQAQAGGIPSYGTANITTEDIEGRDQVVCFSHPAPIDIYLDLTLTVSSPLTSDEETDLKEKIVEWGNNLGIGQAVIVFGYNCLVGQLDNEKITDVVVNIDTVFPPVAGDNNIAISDGTTAEVQYSRWSTANIRLF